MAHVNVGMIPPPDPTHCFKILHAAEWEAFRQATVFKGSPVDIVDGFIHLSTAVQAPETAARHFTKLSNLSLIAFDSRSFGESLRWEPSRGGALFPHLYAPLPLSAAVWRAEIPLDADGRHVFPAGWGAEALDPARPASS